MGCQRSRGIGNGTSAPAFTVNAARVSKSESSTWSKKLRRLPLKNSKDGVSLVSSLGDTLEIIQIVAPPDAKDSGKEMVILYVFEPCKCLSAQDWQETTGLKSQEESARGF